MSQKCIFTQWRLAHPEYQFENPEQQEKVDQCLQKYINKFAEASSKTMAPLIFTGNATENPVDRILGKDGYAELNELCKEF